MSVTILFCKKKHGQRARDGDLLSLHSGSGKMVTEIGELFLKEIRGIKENPFSLWGLNAE